MSANGLPADARLPSQDPRCFAVGRLPPRASGWPCADRGEALVASYDRAPGVRWLNGDWRCHWAPEPSLASVDFAGEGFDDSGWPTMPVPGMCELHGRGTPIYSNYVYPFAVRPPLVMEEPPAGWTAFGERNPTVSYRQRFTVPAAWAGRRVVLHFAGARSAMRVWVNGREIGYSESAHLPTEFDVTDAVRTGDNLLAVRVWKWCAGSYLEDQDMWRLCGIHRDVALYSLAPAHLWDWQVRTVGVQVHLRCTVEGAFAHRVRLVIVRPDERTAAEVEVPVVDGIAQAMAEVADAEPWTHEDPRLHRAVLELLAPDGTVVEARGRDLGFRSASLGEDGFRLNGAVVKLQGVNRHEHDPDTGPVPAAGAMEADLRAIRAAHFNLVRASHYPNDPRFYELCDRLGLLVMDEADIESHGLSYHKRELPGDRPEWLEACRARIARMVVRDRGHACVVLWSLGNEAGFGTTFPELAEEIRRLDAEARPVQYADMNLAADMDSQTYPSVPWLRLHLAGKAVRKGEQGQVSHVAQHGPYPSTRPFFLNEYAHARGTALGNFAAYWELMRREPRLIGGCIWSWRDLNLARVVDGRRVLARGGDFGDQPNDGDYCECGLVDADGRPHPHLHEVITVQQPFAALVGSAADRVRLVNRHAFRDLATCRFAWSLLVDGEVAADGELVPCAVPAGGEAELTVPGLAATLAAADGERVLRITGRSAEGSDIGWGEIPLGGAWRPRPPAVPRAGVEESSGDLVVSDGRDRFAFGADGWPVAWEVDGRALLTGSPRLNCWRAPTSGDRGWGMPRELACWREAGPGAVLRDRTVQADAGGVRVACGYDLSAVGSSCTVAWRVVSPRQVEVEVDLAPCPAGVPGMPRVGMAWPVAGDLRTVAWYGRGPHAAYRDRRACAGLGRWTASVDDWAPPMPRPQETGNRMEVRWAELSGAGRRLRVEALGDSFNLSAWPWTQDDLEATTEAWRLPRRASVTLNVDADQMGLGGDNTWGERIYDEHRLSAQRRWRYAYRLTVEPG